MKKLTLLLSSLMFTFLFVQNSSAITDGWYCPDDVSWAAYGCDAQYDQCSITCEIEDEDCLWDCDYQYWECTESQVFNGLVIGKGAVVAGNDSATFRFNLACDGSPGYIIANARIGYSYYQFSFFNPETYCYEMYGERMVCGNGQGTMNGQPIDAAWCIYPDENLIVVEDLICGEVSYGYIYPVTWESPFFFDGDGYFGFRE